MYHLYIYPKLIGTPLPRNSKFVLKYAFVVRMGHDIAHAIIIIIISKDQ